MTKDECRKKLKNAGYSVSHNTSGSYFAVKGQRTYKADSLNGLVNKIFK